MTVNEGSLQDITKDITDSIEVIKLSNSHKTPKRTTPNKKSSSSSFFAFKKKSSATSNESSNSNEQQNNKKKSFTSKMRKFVSNGNQNNANAPVQSRKKKKSDSSNSDSTRTSSAVSRSSSEPALNQPQEAFVREAPSMTSLAGKILEFEFFTPKLLQTLDTKFKTQTFFSKELPQFNQHSGCPVCAKVAMKPKRKKWKGTSRKPCSVVYKRKLKVVLYFQVDVFRRFRILGSISKE